MSDCNECKHYEEELDVNYFGCDINADDKYWMCEITCPYFEDIAFGDEE